MTWNYRIILHPVTPETVEAWYGLHEVYYDDAGTPNGWTGPISFVCGLDEGTDGIVKSLAMALEDAKKYPVLVAGPDDKLVQAA